MDSSTPVLSCRSIAKVYESNHVQACDDISLDLHAGEIHCILGENGAGKSTLMRILTGDQTPDSGQLYMHGAPCSFSSPHDSLMQGVGMIHQQSNCIRELTVWENIILGAEQCGLLGRVGRNRSLRAAVDRLSSRYGISVPYHEQAAKLDSNAVQTTALLSILLRNAQVLIFDEPHSLFSGDPPVSFQEIAETLAQEGKALAVVTHNIAAAFAVASRITILRRGRSMGTFLPESIDIQGATRLMMGLPPEFTPGAPKPSRRVHGAVRRNPVLSLDQVSTKGDVDNPSTLKSVSLSVHPGEILACVGIKEHGLLTLEALLTSFVPDPGSTPPELSGGAITCDGGRTYPRSLAEIRRRQFAYVPSNRLLSAAAVYSTVEENAVLHAHSKLTEGKIPGLMSSRQVRRFTESLIHSFAIQGNHKDSLLSLSGGNIQKLIAARELADRPRLLIACEITWGLDVRTQEFLFEQLQEIKKREGSVLLITSETDVALEHSDRIAMFYHGRLVRTAPSADVTASDVGEVILGERSRL